MTLSVVGSVVLGAGLYGLTLLSASWSLNTRFFSSTGLKLNKSILRSTLADLQRKKMSWVRSLTCSDFVSKSQRAFHPSFLLKTARRSNVIDRRQSDVRRKILHPFMIQTICRLMNRSHLILLLIKYQQMILNP